MRVPRLLRTFHVDPAPFLPRGRELLFSLPLIAIYALSAKLGLAFAFLGANVSPLWPPTGIAITALILFGLRLWPGVFLGAFIANVLISPLAPGTAALIAAGNTTEALVAAGLLTQVLNFRPTFERTQDALQWVAVAGAFAPMFGATVGTQALVISGVIPPPTFGSVWWTWWSGDAMGALVLAPPLLVWSQQPWKTWTVEDHHQALQILGFVLAIGLLVFFTPVAVQANLSPLAYATLPPLIWAAFKFGAPGATFASLLTCVIAIWGTVNGHGAYSGFPELNAKMGLLQGFLAVASISSLGFAALASERRRAQAHSVQTEERFRLLVEAVKEYAIFLLDPQGRIVTWNKGAERIKGYTADEILGQHISRFFTDADVKAGRPDLLLQEAASNGHCSAEGVRVRKDGSFFIADVELTALMDEGGDLRGYVKITRDVTERMELLEQLRAHQGDLERLVQSRTAQLTQAQRVLLLVYDSVQDPMGLVSVDADGGFTVVSCNKTMAMLRGNHPRQLVGRRVNEILNPELAGKVIPVLQNVARSAEARRVEWSLSTLVGDRVYDAQIRPLKGESGACAHLLVSGQDVTERLKTESSMREAQKLESLGVLAGGIAHDFNNLLTAILGNASIGSSSLPEGSEAIPLFEQIERSALRAADLTRQLLAYAGRSEFVVIEVDLNVLITEITQLLSVSLPRKARIRFNLHKPLPFVKGDATHMQQMIMNLVINASEALGPEQEGQIIIRTGEEDLDLAEIKQLVPTLHTRPGHYVTFEVVDSGCGMSPDVQARVFDPFFTTKFMGRGLGLSAMLGILRSHGGGLRMRSEVGHGSSFKIYLPALTKVKQPDQPPYRTTESHFEGTLLIVDDEPSIRELAGWMAQDLGFDTLEAKDGLEALEFFRAHRTRISLVFMDLTMPGLGGRETFLEMRRIDPSIPVVLSSGYSVDDVSELLSDHGLAGFLKKPYLLAEFKECIHGVLSQSQRYKTGLPIDGVRVGITPRGS